MHLRCLFAAGILFSGASCAVDETPSSVPLSGRPAANEFSIMSYNLKLFSYKDRDRDGQEDDFKPETEIAPLVALICEYMPDVLAVQELGLEDSLTLLQQRLKDCGIHYEYRDILLNPGAFANLGILSRFPITHTDPLTNLSYSIKGKVFDVQRGFQQVDIQVNPAFNFRLINVHLKSKLFHESGQTEMRRNEARLLSSHIRRLQKDATNIHLVVCGDFNDSYRSAAMRELIGTADTNLTDLQLKDAWGDRWTHYYQGEQSYARIDYFLVNRNMERRWNENKSGIIRDLRTYEASDHRPILSVFKAKD